MDEAISADFAHNCHVLDPEAAFRMLPQKNLCSLFYKWSFRAVRGKQSYKSEGELKEKRRLHGLALQVAKKKILEGTHVTRVRGGVAVPTSFSFFLSFCVCVCVRVCVCVHA